MKVLSPDEMRRMDETCIHQYGIPAQVLMENAASSSFNLIQKNYPILPVLVICGSGNNGGDGLALARKLHSAGREVQILLQGDPGKFSNESAQNFRILQNIGLPLFLNPETEIIQSLIQNTRLIVDAFLGTGLNRDINDSARFLIETINSSGRPVVALDIPSGLDGNSGVPRGAAVKAEMTICFGAPKKGNILGPGIPYNGTLFCSTISFPRILYENDQLKTELNLPEPLPPRDPLGYKNSFGKVLIIGGGSGYLGAPALAARSAYRSGAGYVTAAIPESISSGFSVQCPEAVLCRLTETAGRTISLTNSETLLELSEKHDAVLLGPGMTGDPETVQLIRSLIPRISKPLVVDADGLNALAGHPELTRNRQNETVLTPHQGEQKRLSETFREIMTIEERYGAVCVYKGPRSRISYPDKREYINLTGTSALGTAGTGDVLAGMITAMICSARSVSQGVRTAVLIHGMTAEKYSGAEDSFTASDIIDLLPECIREYREHYSKLNSRFYGRLQFIS